MKRICILICTLLLFAVMSNTVSAADYAHFHFIGFSKNGNYLAFEEYGINDSLEDSSPYSVIYIINVKENRWAIKPFKSNGNVSPYDENGQYDSDKIETRVRDKNKRKANRQLRRFKIIDGNTGLQMAAHLMLEYDTDYEEPTEPPKTAKNNSTDDEEILLNSNMSSNSNSNTSMSNSNTSMSNSNINIPTEVEKTDSLDKYLAFLPQQVSFTKRGNTLYRDGFYQLKIKPVPVTQKNCDEYERDMFSFELSLKNEANETRILQRSGKVPPNRGCVDGYGIQEVHLYHNRLAVFVGVFTRGWEGENLRLMAVTGDLDG